MTEELEEQMRELGSPRADRNLNKRHEGDTDVLQLASEVEQEAHPNAAASNGVVHAQSGDDSAAASSAVGAIRSLVQRAPRDDAQKALQTLTTVLKVC
jgi:hypothetical protein